MLHAETRYAHWVTLIPSLPHRLLTAYMYMGNLSCICIYKLCVYTVGLKKSHHCVCVCVCVCVLQFPFCDGSHGNHNKETGDNVGPLVIKEAKKTK